MNIKEASTKWNLPERRITLLCRNGRIEGAIKQGKEWLMPTNAVKPADGRTKEANENQRENGADPASSDALKKAVEKFKNTYKKYPSFFGFTPYRICPIGAHSDFQLGRITGFAIDKGIHIVYSVKTNGVVEISSLQFGKRAQWHVLGTPKDRQMDWADYLRGATISLGSKYPISVGISAVIAGELPIGGLSSSAAVTIVFLNALCRVNGIKLNGDEIVTIAKEAENQYVGVSCGRLDQSCETYCRKDHMLYLDVKGNKFENIPTNQNMKPYEFVIFFSGLERSLAGSKFNMRVDEARSAAYALKAFAGIEYGKYEETNLRDIDEQIFRKYKDKLPENWAKRAEHWYTEQTRVVKGVECWRSGDIEGYGRLSFESGLSSIENWETGSPELKKLYEIMKDTKGIYGGRFSGAGFKGCCMAIIDPEYEQSILEAVEKEYLKAFPEMEGKYMACVCHSENGVHPEN